MPFHYRNHCTAFITGTNQQSLSTLRDAVRRSNLTFQSILCFIPRHWRCTPVTLMDGPLLNPIWSSQPRLQCYRQADCRSNGIQYLSKLGQKMWHGLFMVILSYMKEGEAQNKYSYVCCQHIKPLNSASWKWGWYKCGFSQHLEENCQKVLVKTVKYNFWFWSNTCSITVTEVEHITPFVFHVYLYTEHGNTMLTSKNKRKVLHSFEQAIWANGYKT